MSVKVCQGSANGDHFGNHEPWLIGQNLSANVGFIDITVTDAPEIIFRFTTPTKGQLKTLDTVQAGAIRLAGGGAGVLTGADGNDGLFGGGRDRLKIDFDGDGMADMLIFVTGMAQATDLTQDNIL